MKNYNIKTCRICGKLFKPGSNRQVCCSRECGKENQRAWQYKYHHGFFPPDYRIAKGRPETLEEKLIRYTKLGLSYGYGVVADHPEWSRVTV